MIDGGDDLGKIIHQAITEQGLKLIDDDIVCVAQKIVSKSENRMVALTDVSPSKEANLLAEETEKDPRLVQLILDESDEILRKKPGVLIVRHRLGIVGANAGIDQSNIDHQGGEQASDRLQQHKGQGQGVLHRRQGQDRVLRRHEGRGGSEELGRAVGHCTWCDGRRRRDGRCCGRDARRDGVLLVRLYVCGLRAPLSGGRRDLRLGLVPGLGCL